MQEELLTEFHTVASLVLTFETNYLQHYCQRLVSWDCWPSRPIISRIIVSASSPVTADLRDQLSAALLSAPPLQRLLTFETNYQLHYCQCLLSRDCWLSRPIIRHIIVSASSPETADLRDQLSAALLSAPRPQRLLHHYLGSLNKLTHMWSL